MPIRLTILLLLLNLGKPFAQSGLIPEPVSYRQTSGDLRLNQLTGIVSGAGVSNQFIGLAQAQIRASTGLTLPTKKTKSTLFLSIDSITSKQPEGYALQITPQGIRLTGHDEAGLFYGLQSLTQLFSQATSGIVPACEVTDYPRFSYRGMHLDVSRHQFPIPFIKKYIDLLALYKFNTFHWHLTDDQGWRIEIKRYPALQQKAAYRSETLIGHKKELPHRFDGKRYGGYYTQAEVKDIIQYATQRHITIIPEIEMPGHALAALSAYPELGCLKPNGQPGGPYQAATFWGIFDDVFCAGNDSTFTFLEGVLDEVVALFPSKYIHIGGDECPKTRWKTCTRCQARIQREHLKNEEELQRYFVRRMDMYLIKKGRHIIGWDEILEGTEHASSPSLRMSPEAIVMSWRGIQGGIEAIRQKHNAIMTPESHVYFDYYQSLYPEEPLAAAGYTPLSKVYAYEPIPAELRPDEAVYLKGVQGTAWSEYMDSPEKAEYMVFPRAMAVAEIAWSPRDNRNYADFLRRLRQQETLLKQRNVNYANRFDELTDTVSVNAAGGVDLKLSTTLPDATVRYTIDGTTPTLTSAVYSKPLSIAQTSTVKAAVFRDSKQQGRVFQKAFTISKATGKPVTFTPEPMGGYRPASPLVAVNGVAGTSRYNTGEWIGFQGKDAEVIIDLQATQTVSSIGTHILNYHWQRMWAPQMLQMAVSEDGKTFREVYQQTQFPVNGINPVRATFSPVQARYVRIRATNKGVIPANEYGAGGKAWLLLDEFRVD
ncbi:glycoside hydrolase family 20 protein [Spirosoma sp. RP8]|uniref:beta-N-acetylhexosaminidase n=1 Tax=Spirosoma liriopis TaxID=2937440 RepID=A0ABT0HPY7_9BACT|nr:family 20 glycosylhydrolase [Spirosoma liriopis]MCK8494239.1 glycoside hydrolase family 20 protein [Spirosoma liriopis]